MKQLCTNVNSNIHHIFSNNFFSNFIFQLSHYKISLGKLYNGQHALPSIQFYNIKYFLQKLLNKVKALMTSKLRTQEILKKGDSHQKFEKLDRI